MQEKSAEQKYHTPNCIGSINVEESFLSLYKWSSDNVVKFILHMADLNSNYPHNDMQKFNQKT